MAVGHCVLRTLEARGDMMVSMAEDEMAPEDFDRRLVMGPQVALDVRIRGGRLPLYTVDVTHGGGFNGGVARRPPRADGAAVEQVPASL